MTGSYLLLLLAAWLMVFCFGGFVGAGLAYIFVLKKLIRELDDGNV